MRRPRLLVFAVLALLTTISVASPLCSHAADRPVTPADNLGALLNSAVPGDTFILADGQYGGAYVSTRPGVAGNPVTVKAANPGKAIISGNAVGRQDALSLYKCPYWTMEGLVTEKASRAGLYLGLSSNVTVKNHTSRNNGVQGLLAGGSSFVSVLGGVYAFNYEQHGIYASGKIEGWLIEGATSAFNGRAGIQFNSQGSGGVVSGVTVRNCSLNNNGRLKQAAAINCLGVVNSVFAGNTLHDNWAGGISFSGNGAAGGASTGNVVYGNSVTFRPGEGRVCVQCTGGGTNTVTGNRLWTGKTTVQAITAVLPSIIVEAGNTVLPPATTVSEPVESAPAEPMP